MKTNTEKRYRPEFTQLPYGFVNDNIALQKLMRTKGLQYLALYIAIQDRMANHTEEDFTLSYEDLVAETQSFLHIYSTSEEEIEGWLNDLIDVNIVESRVYVNPFTDIQEERYCIASVADALEQTREAWISKIINPLKISKEDKEQLKCLTKSMNDIRKQIRLRNTAKQQHHKMLNIELAKMNCDREYAQVINADIQKCELDISNLYRKLHAIKSQAQSLMKGGEIPDE